MFRYCRYCKPLEKSLKNGWLRKGFEQQFHAMTFYGTSEAEKRLLGAIGSSCSQVSSAESKRRSNRNLAHFGTGSYNPQKMPLTEIRDVERW